MFFFSFFFFLFLGSALDLSPFLSSCRADYWPKGLRLGPRIRGSKGNGRGRVGAAGFGQGQSWQTLWAKRNRQTNARYTGLLVERLRKARTYTWLWIGREWGRDDLLWEKRRTLRGGWMAFSSCVVRGPWKRLGLDGDSHAAWMGPVRPRRSQLPVSCMALRF
ncbi:hypothetical protein LX36DRAFT_256540 [Colletotrichum falcatum]|nr:hypothetical protein LX36DRAFT_256540 [Colletotrichum falcatum]